MSIETTRTLEIVGRFLHYDGDVAGRTFAIGDIHGDLAALTKLFDGLPELTADDTVVFLGDYIDRGPDSAGVVAWSGSSSRPPRRRSSRLRGNHEDAWIQVADEGLARVRVPARQRLPRVLSLVQRPADSRRGRARRPTKNFARCSRARSSRPTSLEWMRTLPYFYEDEHAIYVHAGIKRDRRWLPASVGDRAEARAAVAARSRLLRELSRQARRVRSHDHAHAAATSCRRYTPDDPTDLWAGAACVGLDTACGKGGFLTAFELPAQRWSTNRVTENAASRRRRPAPCASVARSRRRSACSSRCRCSSSPSVSASCCSVATRRARRRSRWRATSSPSKRRACRPTSRSRSIRPSR